MMTDLFCAIYESDHLKTEQEHENDEASSDYSDEGNYIK